MDSNYIDSIRPPLSEIRIILWDIDGTLMRSTQAGAYKEYFAPALERVYGSSGRLGEMRVSGMTDTEIAYEALKDEGFTPECIIGKKDELLIVFREEMSRVIKLWSRPYKTLEGVPEILERTDRSPVFINAILSGNLSCAAEIKLSFVGLWKFFENVPHAFGEISHDRRRLAAEAGKIYSKFLRYELSSEQFIVIGDTPNDIACARAFGAKVVSVATGRHHSAEDLAAHQPDHLLDDLNDTDELFRILSKI